MPPSNTTALTATNIAALPYNNVQNVFDAGLTYTVWYKYTAVVGENVIGVFGFGDLVNYKPTIFVYTGPAAAPVPYLSIAVQNKPIQMPVTPGTEYFFEFRKNGDFNPSSLTVNAITGPVSIAPAGSIFINDDAPGFPAALISSTVDYTVLRFIYPFPAGEAGDVLQTTGRVLVSDEFIDLNYKLYSNTLTFITDVVWSWTGAPRIRACQGASKFYIGMSGSGITTAKVRTVDNNGALGGTIFDLGAVGLTALAAKNDETILYYSGRVSSLNSEIRRWDLIGNVPLSDLVPDVGGTYRVTDILYLDDDTLIVLYFQSSPRDVFARRYSIAGATLNTYLFGSSHTTTIPRLAYAIDNPNSFWIFTHPTGTGTSVIQNVKCSDGSILTTRNEAEYEGGAYQPSETATPLSRFGDSFSCPLIITRASIGAPSTGTIRVDKFTIPSGHAQIFSFNAVGLTPNAFTLIHGQSHTYNNVLAGSGYGISETVPTNWSVSYSVSNGSPINNISVSAGELVVITVTDTLLPNDKSGIYKIVPGKRNDTLWVTFSPKVTLDVKIP